MLHEKKRIEHVPPERLPAPPKSDIHVALLLSGFSCLEPSPCCRLHKFSNFIGS